MEIRSLQDKGIILIYNTVTTPVYM